MMGACDEVAQHMFWFAEGQLGVDDPIVAEQYSQPGNEGARMNLRQKLAVELELTSMESVAKSGDELAPEDAADHADRQRV